MGVRFRLKANFNISSFSAQNQIILDRAQEVRNDHRGQWQRLVHFGRSRLALERQTIFTTWGNSRARISKLWMYRP